MESSLNARSFFKHLCQPFPFITFPTETSNAIFRISYLLGRFREIWKKKLYFLIRLFSLLLLFVLLLSYSEIVESTNANREKSILLSFLQRAFSLKSLF